MTLEGKPFGGGFDTTTLIDTGLVGAVKRREDAVLEVLHLRRPAVTPAAEVVELLLALSLERRQRRIAGSAARRRASIAADSRLTCGDEKMCRWNSATLSRNALRRLNRRFHVLVDGSERLHLERRSRTVLLVRRGVLQHVQRGHGARQRHMRCARIGRQPVRATAARHEP